MFPLCVLPNQVFSWCYLCMVQFFDVLVSRYRVDEPCLSYNLISCEIDYIKNQLKSLMAIFIFEGEERNRINAIFSGTNSTYYQWRNERDRDRESWKTKRKGEGEKRQKIIVTTETNINEEPFTTKLILHVYNFLYKERERNAQRVGRRRYIKLNIISNCMPSPSLPFAKTFCTQNVIFLVTARVVCWYFVYFFDFLFICFSFCSFHFFCPRSIARLNHCHSLMWVYFGDILKTLRYYRQ